MEQFVHTLRKKPVHVRQRILILSMIVLMVLVVALWIATLQNRAHSALGEKQGAAPFSMLKSGVTNLLKSGDTPAPAPTAQQNTAVEVTPEKMTQ